MVELLCRLNECKRCEMDKHERGLKYCRICNIINKEGWRDDKALCKEVQILYAQVGQRMPEEFIKKAPLDNKYFGVEDTKVIIRMSEEGASISEIAREVSANYGKVKSFLIRFGMDYRTVCVKKSSIDRIGLKSAAERIN